MKKGLFFLIIIIVILGIIFVLLPKNQKPNQNLSMTIASSIFNHNELIPKKYTCDGENINPPLAISGIPEGAKSLALIMDDPDAPGGTWVHWLIWNISQNTSEISENSVPADSVEGTTSFEKTGYGGPCPPSGTHRYFFKIYALDTILELNPSATKTGLEKAMENHILEKSELIGLYRRTAD